MINLPNQEKQWNQANQSDLFGNVHVTKNITFDTEGYLNLSYSSRASMNETIDADFDNPAVMLFNEDYNYFVATWDSAFQTDSNILKSYPIQITTSGVPSTDIQTDAVWFGGLMAVSQDTDLDYYNVSANTWTDTNISLNNNGQHPLQNFWSLSALAVANVNTVGMYAQPLTATPTLINTLTISSDLEITSMVYFNQNLYIGTYNVYGGNAYMYVWNGLGTAAQQVYEVKSPTILSMCVHQDAVWLTVGNGSLLKFNGGSFDFVDAFPMYYNNQSMVDNLGNLPMYKNTMVSNGHLLYILFSNDDNNNNRLLDQPDGIWCYDPKVGLYHRYSMSNSLVSIQTTSTVNTTTNEITVTASPVTGTEVVFNESSGLSPLNNGVKYYVIKVSATVIKLAYTLEDALAGNAIDLITSGGSNSYTFFPNVDFGQYYTSRTMALTVIDGIVQNPIYGTEILWGGEVAVRDSASSDYGTLGTVSNGVGARGYFITPKIFSSDVTDTFNLVSIKFSPFTSELDKIIIKYRLEDDMKQYINLSSWDMAWTSSTTFTTSETGWSEAIVGNEVEILMGAGGGLLGHITSISQDADTGIYTVTLDESYDNYTSGDVGRAIFRNWIKWKTIEYGDSNAGQHFLSTQLGKSGKFLQMKVELRGVRTRIEQLLVDNKYRLIAQSK